MCYRDNINYEKYEYETTLLPVIANINHPYMLHIYPNKEIHWFLHLVACGTYVLFPLYSTLISYYILLTTRSSQKKHHYLNTSVTGLSFHEIEASTLYQRQSDASKNRAVSGKWARTPVF